MLTSIFLSAVTEPQSYVQARESPHWVKAMEVELDAPERNQTWDLTFLPESKKAIGSKWVYKVKLKADGIVKRFKARLGAKGYNQVHGIDYHESFSPISKNDTARLIFSNCNCKGMALTSG